METVGGFMQLILCFVERSVRRTQQLNSKQISTHFEASGCLLRE